MYILGIFTCIIPVLMIIPILIAWSIDWAFSTDIENIDHPITSNLNQLAIGYFAGSLLYFGILVLTANFDYVEFDIFDWKPRQLLGIISPVLFAGLLLFRKARSQLKLMPSTRDTNINGAGALYLLLTIVPFSFSLFFVGLPQAGVVTFVFPGLFGLWLVSSVSTYTWKFYLTYTILTLLSLRFYYVVLFGFFAM